MYSLELREQIARYISSEISLEDLENWLVQNLPRLAVDPRSDDSSLAAAVDLCLVEYSAGLRTEESIKRYLSDALEEFKTVYINLNDASIISSSSLSKTEQYTVAVGTNALPTQFWLKSGYNVSVRE